jgi:hypothetical protein
LIDDEINFNTTPPITTMQTTTTQTYLTARVLFNFEIRQTRNAKSPTEILFNGCQLISDVVQPAATKETTQ